MAHMTIGTLNQDDVPTQDIVPAAFAATRPKRAAPVDTKDPLQRPRETR